MLSLIHIYSYISNTQFISLAEEVAEKCGIKYQESVRRGGSTNAAKISVTGEAVPCLCLLYTSSRKYECTNGAQTLVVWAFSNFVENLRTTISDVYKRQILQR